MINSNKGDLTPLVMKITKETRKCRERERRTNFRERKKKKKSKRIPAMGVSEV